MKAIKDIFLPPGIQMRLHANPPHGDALQDFAVAQIDALWARRNIATDADVERIDNVIESIIRSESDSASYSYPVPYARWTPAQIEQVLEKKLGKATV